MSKAENNIRMKITVNYFKSNVIIRSSDINKIVSRAWLLSYLYWHYYAINVLKSEKSNNTKKATSPWRAHHDNYEKPNENGSLWYDKDKFWTYSFFQYSHIYLLEEEGTSGMQGIGRKSIRSIHKCMRILLMNAVPWIAWSRRHNIFKGFH